MDRAGRRTGLWPRPKTVPCTLASCDCALSYRACQCEAPLSSITVSRASSYEQCAEPPRLVARFGLHPRPCSSRNGGVRLQSAT